MIGKAKIFLYALFSPNKHVPPGYLPVKWHHKCILVLTRQCKNFKDCPKEIRYFEWQKATEKSRKILYWTKGAFYCVITCWLTLRWREKHMARVEKRIEERRKADLPEIGKYHFGLYPDTWYHKYNTEFPPKYPYP